jgi:hypothetical protein
MHSGAQVALQSGVVIALLSVAPIFLWLGIVCYMFSLEDRSVLTFGFGLALVNLTVRVGGSIFSKSVQQADETERHRRQTGLSLMFFRFISTDQLINCSWLQKHCISSN